MSRRSRTVPAVIALCVASAGSLSPPPAQAATSNCTFAVVEAHDIGGQSVTGNFHGALYLHNRGTPCRLRVANVQLLGARHQVLPVTVAYYGGRNGVTRTPLRLPEGTSYLDYTYTLDFAAYRPGCAAVSAVRLITDGGSTVARAHIGFRECGNFGLMNGLSRR